MKSYQEKLASLSKLGVMSGKEYNTPGRKSAITKKWEEWKGVVYNPESFHKANVGEKTARDLKAAGFKVIGKRAFIPKGEFQKVRISKGRVIFEGKNFTETVPLIAPKNVDQYLQKKLKVKSGDEYITARIGDKSPFKQKFTSAKDLNKYLKNFQPKKASALRHISIVKMKRRK